MENKIRKIFFVLLFSAFLLLSALTALAEYKLEVGIPGQVGEDTAVSLTDYIRYIYLFALGAVGIAALGTLIIAGFMYMLSDLVTTKEEARKYIMGAIWGLLIGLGAYLILYTINPDLIRLKAPNLESPESGQSSSEGGTSSGNTNTNAGQLPSQSEIWEGEYLCSKPKDTNMTIYLTPCNGSSKTECLTSCSTQCNENCDSSCSINQACTKK